MKKLLLFSVSMLFSVSVFAEVGAPANMQGYADCIKKNETIINQAKTLCDTEAKVRSNPTCMKIARITQDCSCDNNFNADPKVCAALKSGKTAKPIQKTEKVAKDAMGK